MITCSRKGAIDAMAGGCWLRIVSAKFAAAGDRRVAGGDRRRNRSAGEAGNLGKPQVFSNWTNEKVAVWPGDSL